MIAGRRARGFGWLPLTVGVLVVFVSSNLLAAAAGERVVEPLDHYSWPAQTKVHQMDAIRGRRECVDAVVLGPSLGMHSFDPEIVGPRWGGAHIYNAAILGTPVSLDVEWYTEWVRPRLGSVRPMFVLSPVSFSASSTLIQETVDGWQRSRATRPGLLGTLDRLLARLLPLVRYRQRLSDPAHWPSVVGGRPPEDLANAAEFARRFPENGFITVQPPDQTYVEGSAETERVVRQVVDWLGRPEVDEGEIEVLEGFLTDSGDEVDPVLVMMPYSRRFVRLLPGGESFVQTAYGAVRSMAERHGAHLVDLTGARVPEDWFYDTFHLNARGAGVVSRALGDALERMQIPLRCNRRG